MVVAELQRRGAEMLRRSGLEDAAFDARQLLAHVLHTGSAQLPLWGDRPVTAGHQARYLQLISRRARRYPLQYLLGSWPFYDGEYLVGEGVLIPRPDTERLCEIAIELAPGLPGYSAGPAICDLCSGSGCIAVTLQKHIPGSHVTAVEKSPAAFRYLQKNIALNGADVQPVLADVLGYEHRCPPCSLITANPPYITAAEMAALQPEVCYEPAMALAAGADGLGFYRAIARRYLPCLLPGGALILEIGASQGPAVTEILKNCGYSGVFIARDYAQNDRVAVARRPAAG